MNKESTVLKERLDQIEIGERILVAPEAAQTVESLCRSLEILQRLPQATLGLDDLHQATSGAIVALLTSALWDIGKNRSRGPKAPVVAAVEPEGVFFDAIDAEINRIAKERNDEIRSLMECSGRWK